MVKITGNMTELIATNFCSKDEYMKMRESLVSLLMHIARREDSLYYNTEINALCDVIYILSDECE